MIFFTPILTDDLKVGRGNLKEIISVCFYFSVNMRFVPLLIKDGLR